MHALTRLIALSLLLLPACTFYSTAHKWNGRVGIDGKPIHVESATHLGINLMVVIPAFGSSTFEDLVDDVTQRIAKQGGDKVRVVTWSTSNVWWAIPPLTWVFSPVETTVSIEYEAAPKTAAAPTSRDRSSDSVTTVDPSETGGSVAGS